VRFTRGRDLLVVAVLTGLAVHLLLGVAYDELPQLPRFAGTTLALIGVVEAVLGYSLRSRILRREGTRPVPALTAARAVLLAKASSLLGAIMLGGWLAVIVYALPLRDQFPAASADTTTGVIGAGCAAVLVGAALWLEHCCRTPGGPDTPRDDEYHRPAV
jgi:hypothetical protein